MDEEDEHFLSASHGKCILLSGTECHIINYLLTELSQAVPGNIGLRLFLYGPRCARSALSRPWADIPKYGPCARLVRGYYCYHFEGHWQNKNWKKSDNETVQRQFLSPMLEGKLMSTNTEMASWFWLVVYIVWLLYLIPTFHCFISVG